MFDEKDHLYRLLVLASTVLKSFSPSGSAYMFHEFQAKTKWDSHFAYNRRAKRGTTTAKEIMATIPDPYQQHPGTNNRTAKFRMLVWRRS